MKRTLWVGYDAREIAAYQVAKRSADARLSGSMPVNAVVLDFLRNTGVYRRPTQAREGRLWDAISDAPMATEFAISRFLVPHMAGSHGWALFTDCDVLFRRDPNELFELADDRYAVMCVKHTHMPTDEAMLAAVDAGRAVDGGTKMDGQAQTFYPRKNWSSVVLWNLEHPANKRLTVDLVNTAPGRDLHRFCWLANDEIGQLPGSWNHLVGVDPRRDDANLVHFTLGIPSMPGYEDSEYADEWRSWL